VANGDISTLSSRGDPVNDHFLCSAWGLGSQSFAPPAARVGGHPWNHVNCRNIAISLIDLGSGKFSIREIACLFQRSGLF
jgi:hypothetical protein